MKGKVSRNTEQNDNDTECTNRNRGKPYSRQTLAAKVLKELGSQAVADKR